MNRIIKREILFLIIVCFMCVSAYAQSGITWVKTTELYVPQDNPTNTSPTPNALNGWRGSYCAFVSNGAGAGGDAFAPDVWHTVDVKLLGIPSDAKAVFIHALLIITHSPYFDEIAGITLSYRRFGATFDNTGWYHTQTAEPAKLGGVRTNDAMWVPIEDGKFQFKWHRQAQIASAWPIGSSFGINMVVNAWAR